MGILSDLVSAGATIAGVNSQIKTNDLNYQLQRENLDYQKAIQETIFNREDNAVQRRVADLKKAGLSPILAAGSAAGAGSVVSTSAPQKKSNLEAMAALASVQTLIANQQKARTEADLMKNQLEQDRLNTEYYKSHGLAPVQANQSWQQYLVNLLAPKLDSQIALPVVDSVFPSFAGAVKKAVDSNALNDVNKLDVKIVEEGNKVVNKATGAYLTTFQAGLLKQKGLYQQWVSKGFTPDVVKALRISPYKGGGSSW